MRMTFTLARWALAALLAGTSPAGAQTVKIAGLLELTGSGATSGNNFDKGAALAVKEINARGGMLGRKIDYRAHDTQSNPGVALGLAEQVVTEGVYAVLGPVYSGSVLVSMAATRKAGIPNFTGGEAGAITAQGSAYIFRTSIAQVKSMPRIARYIQRELKAGTVDLIYANNDFGRSGREQLMKSLRALDIQLGADISIDPGQVNYVNAVRKARQARGDALFVYTNEEEAARILRELRKQAYARPVVGESVLTSQTVIELAGDAANGAVAHTGLTADAPNPLVQRFDQAFRNNGMVAPS